MRSRFQKPLGRFLIAALALNSFIAFAPVPTSVRAQKRVIVVNAEQPNVWTLEQAHYLLAQMHRRNLDLKAKSLEDLDPNEIAGLRFDVMRMLVEFGATFNQADLASNRLVSANQTFNSQRRQELLTERDRLRRESLRLTGEIEELETEKAGTDDEDAKKRLDARIAAKNTRLSKVDKEIEFVNGELGTLTAPSGELKPTEGGAQFDANKFPESVFDKAFEEAAAKQIEKFNESPKLNASLRLDNFLQMQYEIISKQLSLLRDELGPGERLVFLELPQTVNVAHHESNQKWAQSWWKIAGYTRRMRRPYADTPVPLPTPRPAENHEPITTVQDVNSILKGQDFPVRLATPTPPPIPTPTPSGTPVPPPPPQMQAMYYDDFVNLDSAITGASPLNSYLNANSAKLENRMVRTVELIPRQSSLNVNDMKLKTSAGAFNFVLSTLFGFGSQLNIQRQREQFSQFVQQELYSSAFGKGSREFGWTFTPMPGTERLQSGVRTTYAIVVVPEEATSLVLESNGCYFPRSYYQPNDFNDTKDTGRWGDRRTSRGCGSTTKAFVVPIPSARVNGGNEFWIEKISYQPVGKGKRVVVSVSGKNFSPQVGVLINGIPLVHSIGLAQPLIRDDSQAGRATADEFKEVEIPGRIERIDSNKVVFSFKMPPDFQGTPTITMIAPGRATDLNWINLEINGVPNTTLTDFAKKMFGHGPAPDSFRIDKLKVFRAPAPGFLTALVGGAGFVNTGAGYPQVLVNGNSPSSISFESATLLRVTFAMPADETIKVTLVSLNTGDAIESEAITNPARLSIADVEVVVYEVATEDEPATLVVKIRGTGFTDKLKTSVGEIAVKSATEAILTITDPKAAAVVTLTDEDTNQVVKTIITRKTRAPD